MSKIDIEIRSFAEGDHSGVVSLWNEVFAQDPPWNEPAALIRRKKTVQPELFFVAGFQGRIIGTVVAGYDGVRGWIHHLAVHPLARRNGVATRLMRAAEAALQERGCPKVNLQVRIDNADVVAFYRTLGYEVEERVSMGKLLLGKTPGISEREELGRALVRACLLRGEFRLRSGRTASEYFDKYLFESDPNLLQATALALGNLLPNSTQALAGLELGGVPLATAISQATRIPVLFVRKTAKECGTRGIAEGGEVAGKRIVVIEDVITSGGQALESAMRLREAGADILCVACVVDRETGGSESLAAAGLELRSLFKFSELRTLEMRATRGTMG